MFNVLKMVKSRQSLLSKHLHSISHLFTDRRLQLLDGIDEMASVDLQVDSAGIVIDGFLESLQRRLADESGQVSACVSVGQLRNLDKVDVFGKFRLRSVLGESFEDVDAVFIFWQANVEDFIQTAWSQHCGIDDVRSIGGGHQENAFAVLDAVHFGKQLVHDALTRVLAGVRSFWAQRVELVEEDDARCRVAGSLETLTNCALALADVLRR